MLQKHHSRSSYKDTIKGLETDIQHANSLAAAIPRVCGGACLQMRLSYSPFAPIFLFFIQWMDCSCTYELPSYLGLLHILVYKVHVDGKTAISSNERKASLREFYAVIYPSLQQLEGDLTELESTKQRDRCTEMFSGKRVEERRQISDRDSERDDECGICMEACTRMVLPDCGHAMCNRCYHDWNTRSQSCPFCRGSLKRVNSDDLWVLTSNGDVIDPATLARENLRRFYIYIDGLPLTMPETFFYVYDYII
ncbi:E3 ubiquitin-protein ligase AIRP2-like [Magnolia sinica]|uniref:E3 ubiquitin-protein ligase AIRP2-like n=1 Tax=Magnolia sinica TaxID=86752 RepID=UPI00265880A3|nr:E3 ubiquitin-protein ligase AIRP2-like [Magnolia sinica]